MLGQGIREIKEEAACGRQKKVGILGMAGVVGCPWSRRFEVDSGVVWTSGIGREGRPLAGEEV